MPMNSAGFNVTDSDKRLIISQRAITKIVNDQFIQVGAIFLKMSGKLPFEEDWFKRERGDTDLQTWIDDETYLLHNVGFNLQLGWLDIDIDAGDPEYNRCLMLAFNHTGIDTRFKFGRVSVGAPSHVLVQLGEEEAKNWERLAKFAPRDFRIDGKRFFVELRSYPTILNKENLPRMAKQTVMPGSIYTHKTQAGDYDISVWYDNKYDPARGIGDVAATTPRKASFNEIVRAIAFGTFLYIVRDHWIEGQRQSTAHTVTGWLARVVREGAAMNNHDVISEDVFCPIDDDDIAEGLIKFVCQSLGDEESYMRVRAYHDARAKLARNPDAKVPGWPAMDQLVGAEGTLALRAVFTPGSDVSLLTKMADRYIYDETDNLYIDRQRHSTPSGKFVHAGEELERRHRSDVVRIGKKPKEAFRVFETSDIRKRVDMREFYPDLAPGGIYRVDTMSELVSDDDAETPAVTVFNTWRGWPIRPAETINEELMDACIARLDKLLAFLTRDEPAQIEWVKKWIAWTIQHPGTKQQIAWVCVGGQGVGKSFMGNRFLHALIGNLWGVASPQVLEGAFSVAPFKDKMIVFIDEAKFHSEQSTDEIKKLIRNVDVPGQEKFIDARNYRLFSRVMFASNRYDMNIGQSNTNDRALFYTKAYDKDYLAMGENEFRRWAEQLLPWFVEFNAMLDRKDVLEHYMYYFTHLDVDLLDVQSIKHSSSNDPEIVASNMGWARRVAKHIIEDARVMEDVDILYPFGHTDFNKRVFEVSKELGLRAVQPQRVLAELQDAGLLDVVTAGAKKSYRFKYRLATLLNKYGDAIGTPLERRYVLTENDEGNNDQDFGGRPPPWRGKADHSFAKF